MRFIYKLLFGMIFFNGIMTLLFLDIGGVSIFPNDVGSEVAANAMDPTANDSFLAYKQPGTKTLYTSLITFSAILFVSGGIAIIARGSINLNVIVGIGAFIAILGSLWVYTSSVFTVLTNYPIVSGLYVLITIAIGVLAVLSVVEMLTQQSGAGV